MWLCEKQRVQRGYWCLGTTCGPKLSTKDPKQYFYVHFFFLLGNQLEMFTYEFTDQFKKGRDSMRLFFFFLRKGMEITICVGRN